MTSEPLDVRELEVRVLGEDDWATWRDIRLRALQDSPDAFGSTYARERAYSEQEWRGHLDDPDDVTVLVQHRGRPVATGGGYQDRPGLLHVIAMWVDPSVRGQGVGHLVLDAVRRWGEQRGLGLHLDVAQGNAGARRSYERYGFVATGETRPLREGAPEVVERMVLPVFTGARGGTGSTDRR
jgi:GNAT superfamily N-acetyltransferase